MYFIQRAYIEQSRYFQYSDSQFNSTGIFLNVSLLIIVCLLCVSFSMLKTDCLHDGWALQLNHISSSHFLFSFGVDAAFVFRIFEARLILTLLHFFSCVLFPPRCIIHSLCECSLTGCDSRWLVLFAYVIFCSSVSTTVNFCFYVVLHLCMLYAHTNIQQQFKMPNSSTTSCPMFIHSNIYSNHLHYMHV